MLRDIRDVTPAYEILRFVAWVCMGRTSKRTRRDYAGFAVGKRRKLAIAPYIARDMAKEVVRTVNVAKGGWQFPQKRLPPRLRQPCLASVFILQSSPQTSATHR